MGFMGNIFIKILIFKNVLELKSKLRNVQHLRIVGNHVDFLIIPDMLKKVVDDMLKFMRANQQK